MKEHLFSFLAIFVLCVFTSASAQTTHYVKEGGTGDGTSWANASGDLQLMINTSIAGDQLWVAGGTYYPIRRADALNKIAMNDRHNAFVLKKDIKIYGGFAGTETLLTARDLSMTTNASILSGNIGDPNINTDNAYHVVISVGDEGTTELNGFSIKDGNGNGGIGRIVVLSKYIYTTSGGGILISNSSLTLTNVTISGNDATHGGGIYNDNSSPVLTNVTISLNNANSNGGGMQNDKSSPVLTNVIISGNNAYNSTGGGIYNGTSSSPVLTNVIISGNYAYRGAGIFNFAASPVLTNVTISGNNASGSGGGIFNSTNASPKIRNTIIFGNSNGIANVSTAAPVISYSLVQGLLAGSSGSNLGGFYNPWFISSPSFNTAPFTGGDYRLQAGSPVIHKGNNAYYSVDSIPNLSAITTDLDGNPRGMETTSMGVYESSVISRTIYYVKEDGTGDGSNWANASGDLQLMINSAVAGDQVWVAGGTYYPVRRADALNTISINDRNNAFVLKKAVKIYGGFAGINETTLTQRDPTGLTNTTILSGDLGTMGDATDNAYHVVISVDDVGAAELDGFSIKNAYAHGTDSIVVSSQSIIDAWGGGIYISSSSPVLSNVIISGNNANRGGGVYNQFSSSPLLTNVTVSENIASMFGGGVYNDSSFPALTNVTVSGNNAGNAGGGIYNNSSSPVLMNVTINENVSDNGGGGGIYNSFSSPLLTKVTITGNTANSYGGGIYNANSSSPVLTNVTVNGNKAITEGGGIYNIFSSSPVLTNVVVSGNVATNGGGIYNSSSSTPLLTNVTISGNDATTIGGGIFNNSSSLRIRNTIIYGNSDGIVNINSSPIITYSLVQGLTNESNGNISGDKDPLFANLLSPGLSTGGSYRLKNAESPGYNSGSNDFYSMDSIPDLSAITTDLDGNPRNTKTIGMGAYEYFLTTFYVKEGGTGDGTSWANASNDLQAMINSSVEWGQVWVAGGTYYPIRRSDALNTISLHNRNNAFVLKKDVKIYGGFAGIETVLSARDLSKTANASILSGNIGDPDINTDNAYHVVISTGGVGIAGLDGFDIIGGNANVSGSVVVSSEEIFNNLGGGIYNSSSSPVLTNLTINSNDAGFGGGICNYKNSSPVLTNVNISENNAAMWGGGIYSDTSSYFINKSTIAGNNAGELGGGIYNASSSPILTNVTITENIASLYGGGIYNTLSSPVLTDVTISGNNATNSGGGIYNNFSSSPGLTNVNITGNAATNGGGIFNSSASSPALTNVNISGNAATDGGGIFNSSSSPLLTNVTIGGNKATTNGGGIYNEVSSFPKIRNTIIYNNSDGIVNNNSTPVTTYSLVQGSTDESNGNISGDKDPLFVDPLIPGLNTGGDYRLKNKESPAYNSGSNFYSIDSIPDLSAITRDLDGNPRNTETINMGAYEHSATLPKVYYVKEDGTGDGTSWASASGDLQSIINSSVGWNQIWVAGGTYYPIRRADALNTISMDDRFNAFVLKKDVKIYGGFGGTEIELTQRDSTRITNNTILSGDLGTIGDIDDNAFHVVISVGNVGAAELNGFSITDGHAPSVEGQGIKVLSEHVGIGVGAGIYNTSSSLSLTNITVSGNTADYGGGIFNGAGSPKLTNVTVSGNNGNIFGGGIYNDSCSPVLTNVIVSGNHVPRNGGGIYNNSSSPVLTNVIISGNNALNGAGIYNESSSPVLTNVTISGNYVGDYTNPAYGNGGGIYNDRSSSPKIRNTIIYANVRGIFNKDANSIPTITYSLVQGLTEESNGNISGDKDPLFVDPLMPNLNTGGNFRLESNESPAYNTGSNTFYNPDSIPDLSAITTDLDGNRRDTETIDMGAYEYASAVPVTIVTFTAQAEENRAKLTWITATESNNKEFIISRSADGITFSEIGTIAGAGNTSTRKDYIYFDENPMTGNNFYQLEQLDFDGRRTVTGIRNVQFASLSRINIYPNPVKHTLQLEFKSGIYQKLELTDVNGRLLKVSKIGANDSKQEFNLSTFTSGTYFLRFVGNGQVETRRVVKE